MDSEQQRLLRSLPAVDEVLQAEPVKGLLAEAPRGLVVEAVREVLEEYRASIRQDRYPDPVTREEVAVSAAKRVRAFLRPHLRRVINATGVVLHTNLGRAVLSRKAREAVQVAAAGYTNLELDLATGERGSRYHHVNRLLTRLSGAEDALVVNNNAAAVLLALSTLARGREVIVSRGQLVEIGGSFRVPEVMAQGGAHLVEVGTTNKTYLRDYQAAITPETALLLKVHTSNYRVVGFTRETSLEELVALGRAREIPVMEDLGSGFLVDLTPWGITGEPTVRDSVAKGADVVTFSGDKLLGGPQAGIILGRADLIRKMKAHPLTRALRVDKLTLAALEATLRDYLDLPGARERIPTLRMLTAQVEELQPRAEELLALLEQQLTGRGALELTAGYSEAGGGSLPTTRIPTMLVTIFPRGVTADALVARLREQEPAVMARIQDDRVVLDVRTVLPEEIPLLAGAVTACLT
ncbi:hypothetical protein SY88_07765 [Clostridiales bacterium PH28_bin88]|nr:hypothetical protein SY88_07765 [Clostridiales bacterium PH28_bin88]